jgi:hypothetical protein
MKPDFNVMTKAELRSYVLSHREDQEAFQVLADRLYANPSPQWHRPEETQKIIDILLSTKPNNISE